MNKYFNMRGNKNVTINFNDEKLDIEIKIPTNHDHDQMMEQFSEIGVDGILVTSGADFLEYRLTNFIINLPFEIPIDEKMETFKLWKDCNNNEKKCAINLMDSKLRDLINNAISGIENITEDELGN
jgi:hypothetical protein